jgi:hypothetical protein
MYARDLEPALPDPPPTARAGRNPLYIGFSGREVLPLANLLENLLAPICTAEPGDDAAMRGFMESVIASEATVVGLTRHLTRMRARGTDRAASLRLAEALGIGQEPSSHAKRVPQALRPVQRPHRRAPRASCEAETFDGRVRRQCTRPASQDRDGLRVCKQHARLDRVRRYVAEIGENSDDDT